MTKRTIALIGVFGAVAAGQPGRTAANRIVSQTEVSVNGETLRLPVATGDWFVTATDAHATLSLRSTASGAAARLDVQWDGKQEAHVIDEANNQFRGGPFSSFLLVQEGKNVTIQPSGEEAVTIRVTRIDDHDVEARIESSAPLAVTGTIRLHRDTVPPRRSSGPYVDCDPVIHDKMVGTQLRSPSECEVRFEADVRRVLHGALQKAVASFQAKGWAVESETSQDPRIGLPPGSETQPFQLEHEVELRADGSSAPAQQFARAMEELKSKPPSAASFEEFRKQAYAVRNSTAIGIQIVVNPLSMGFANFKSEHKILQIPGAAYAIASSHTQARTGGDEDSSQEVTFVCLGKWGRVTIVKTGDGGERVDLPSSLDRTKPLLAVQSIRVRIEASPELAAEVLREMELAALEKLLR